MTTISFKGRVYSDSGGRLKVVIPHNIPKGTYWIIITRVDKTPADIQVKATISRNNATSNKFRVMPFPELLVGATVEGRIQIDEAPRGDIHQLRCKWCGAAVSATINGLCDECLIALNAPTPHRAYARGMVDRPQAKHPNLRAASTANNRGAPGYFFMERVSSGEGSRRDVSRSREPLPEAAQEVENG